MKDWEPTRHGGLRRTGVAQRQSTAQIKQRPVVRVHPPVLKTAWAEKLGLPGCPYVIRWRFEVRGLGSVRVHHWLSADDDRAPHDHPWWFLTLVLRGSYDDMSPVANGSVIEHDVLRAGSVRLRPALHRHTVVPGEHGAWTLLITGPAARAWGFWLNGKFIKANKWFSAYGHHPCS